MPECGTGLDEIDTEDTRYKIYSRISDGKKTTRYQDSSLDFKLQPRQKEEKKYRKKNR